MNIFDLSSVIMVGLRLMVAVRRGFYREFIYITSIGVGIVVGWYLYPYVSSALSGAAAQGLTFMRFLDNKTAADNLSFATIVILLVVLLNLAHRPLARRMRQSIERAGMVWFDRLAGFVVGGIEGLVVAVALVLVFFNLFDRIAQPLLWESRTAVMVQQAISLTYPYAGRWFLEVMVDYLRYGPKLLSG